jgi:AbrB family looped-hinge helix DNA binding protein
MASRSDVPAVITSKLTSKAQTVVPRIIRERLGLRPGDTLR